MKISIKTRYALAAMCYLGIFYEDNSFVPLLNISEKFEISKIYLEQVFAILKRSNLVVALKGSKGGYRLSRDSNSITVYEIIYAIEPSIFEVTEETFSKSASSLEKVLQNDIFKNINTCLTDLLSKITLKELISKINLDNPTDSIMYYI